MSKGKKKKNLDFQKVKLKVGRKLKRDSNETKAEFKSRKIILKEVRSHSKDPITALAHHSDHISQHGKLSLLNHFNAALTPTEVQGLTKPLVDSLAKFIIDHSEKVRAATYGCFKTCLNEIKRSEKPLKEFAYLLKPYLDCAFTHIDRGISQDCLKFLNYLANTNEPQVFEPMMHVILRRFDAGNITPQELKVAQRLKHLYLKHEKRRKNETSLMNDHVKPLVWTPANCLLDLDIKIHRLDKENRGKESDWTSDREVCLIPKSKIKNVTEDFLIKIPDASENDQDDDRPKQQSKRFRSV